MLWVLLDLVTVAASKDSGWILPEQQVMHGVVRVPIMAVIICPTGVGGGERGARHGAVLAFSLCLVSQHPLNSELWHYLVCTSVGLGCTGLPVPESSDSVTGGPLHVNSEQPWARTKSHLLAAQKWLMFGLKAALNSINHHSPIPG